MGYRYTVNYAHVNDDVPDVEGGVHHGTGSMDIVTDEPVETQAQKDQVAQTIGRELWKKHNVTGIAVQSIIPQDDSE